MIRYRIDIKEALKARGLSSYVVTKSGLISPSVLVKLGKDDPCRINLDIYNKLCLLLDMQLEDLLEVVPTEEELTELETKIINFKNKNKRGDKK